ncbi:MAG: thrombospondin type-1 domain-containing protein, partial [Deltaproteobacteria bacterium]|nr:thrombospondin type-1 domain-containing protein [Deltaproteobacteria bacterium]
DNLPVCDCDPGYDLYHDLYCFPHVEADADADAESDADGATEADGAPEAEDVPVFTYDWQTGDWGTCSAICGGGTQSRRVTCVRSDGVSVEDALCSGTRPASSRACNTDPCCTTDALVQNRRCDGSEQVQWIHFGSDTGSAEDRAACASQCTTWAAGRGMSAWCCQLYEDSSSGTLWVCRVYDAATSHATAEADRYAGAGRCR